MKFSKKKRVSNQSVLDRYRNRSCFICRTFPSDPCHIKTVGSGGDDSDSNLIALCRVHHTEQHQIGFFKMCEKYPFLKQELYSKGWVFDGNKKLRRE
jgi:hypothetical protein